MPGLAAGLSDPGLAMRVIAMPVWLAPGANPAADAVSVICAGPVPERCDRLNHEVVRLAGNTEAVQDCVLSVRSTASVCLLVAARLTLGGVAVILPGFAGGPAKETCTCWAAPLLRS